MASLTWSDRMGHRNRGAWLLLIHANRVTVFSGASISGVVAVVSSGYTKNGKWSHTAYVLEVAPGVRTIAGHDGWEDGTFREGLAAATGKSTSRWTDFASALGISLDAAQDWLRGWRPKAASHYDDVEAALGLVDEISPDGAEEISVSFGAPTRRSREEGFWDWPIVVTGSDGAVVAVLSPAEYEVLGQHGDMSVLECSHTSGHGGGYISVRLAIPAGARAAHRALGPKEML